MVDAVLPSVDDVEECGGVASNRGAEGEEDADDVGDGDAAVVVAEDDVEVVEDEDGVTSKRGAEGALDGDELDVVVEGARWCAGAHPAAGIGEATTSTSWMSTVEGAGVRCDWRKGNCDSSKTTCLEVMTRRVAGS